MKPFIALLLFGQLLFGALPFTLENLDNLRLLFMNQSDFFTKAQEEALKSYISKRITDAGIRMNGTDPRTFFVKIEAMQKSDVTTIYIQIGVGEEVITKRDNAIQTLAFTYFDSDYIETETPQQDTNESIQFLMDEFLELYKDDQ